MLVALALFAVIALASFTTLDAIVKSRDRTEGRLEEIGAIDRALLLFGRDIMQAEPGAVSGDADAVTIIRAPQTLTWRLGDGNLIRAAGDQRGIGPEMDQALLSDLSSLQLRYLDSVRDWNDQWPPVGADAQVAGVSLVGVEMSITRSGGGGTVLKLVPVTETLP